MGYYPYRYGPGRGHSYQVYWKAHGRRWLTRSCGQQCPSTAFQRFFR